MKTKREEKLEAALKLCRSALHKERQKNKDLEESRFKHKEKIKSLQQKVDVYIHELKKKR